MEIGKTGYKFELALHENWFKKGDILQTDGSYSGVMVEVLSIPKPYYKKWYWKILNILTFRRFFNVKYTYTVKIIRGTEVPESCSPEKGECKDIHCVCGYSKN